MRKPKNAANLRVLSEMTPDDVRRKFAEFTNSYVIDWDVWLQIAESDRVSKFASMLITNGRIGPAFDSIVRRKLGLNAHLKSSDEWITVLREISRDIQGFEKLHGKFTTIVPDMFNKY